MPGGMPMRPFCPQGPPPIRPPFSKPPPTIQAPPQPAQPTPTNEGPAVTVFVGSYHFSFSLILNMINCTFLTLCIY